jgi:choline monooxygenase
MANLHIHDDIRRANTLPAVFYRDPSYWELQREKLWPTTWHYLADAAALASPGYLSPCTLLPGVLDEPLVLSHARDGQRFCLSNVCTHRGKVLVEEPGEQRLIRCGYHGRCFGLDGSCRSMPAFEEVPDFPGAEDHLPRLPLRDWLGLHFASLDPIIDWDEMIAPLEERVSFLPLHTLRFAPEQSPTFTVRAHWALYVDNYLEGLHIPFVHPALNQAIAFEEYAYEFFPYANLQIGIAREEEPCFELPAGHPDHGKRIYAYYCWVFPNLMFNFYPWGLSLNIIEPVSPTETRVRFRSYILADTPFQREDNALDLTELEDEKVVESVQQGIQSRLYHHGRFSPTMEPNVHHFHRLLAQWLNA